MLLDDVAASVLPKAYGGSPPPFNQPGLVALLKSKAPIGSDDGDGGDGVVSWGSRRRSRAPSTPPVIVDSYASPVISLSPEPG